MRIAIGADHGGFDLKNQLAALLTQAGHHVLDFGNGVFDPADDYPDYALPAARAVACGRAHRGILICGSGVGATIAANKIGGVRAALIHDSFSARQGVEDDDMNVLCLGGRTIGVAIAWDCVQHFLSAQFSGAERHRRLQKVAQLEAQVQLPD
jgi:ribose 5-phosphate isomerase B